MARVLVVEDDQALSRALELKLMQEGYQVDVASNGQEALAAMERQEPDAILLDLIMPVMDGVDFLKAMRVERKMKIPVAVLTVMTSGILFDQCRALEVEDYIVKDQASLDDIVAKVRALAGNP